jgi:hypothetical protein
MGYLDQDIDSLRWDNAVVQKTELSDRSKSLTHKRIP